MVKRSAGSATTARLTELGHDLAAAEESKKFYEAKIAWIKLQIAELVTKYELPIKESKSEYLPIDGIGSIRVTRPAAPVQKLLTASLRRLISERIDDEVEANEVFLNVLVLPVHCEVDIDVWKRYVDDETLVNSMLMSALEPERSAPKPNVQLTTRHMFETE